MFSLRSSLRPASSLLRVSPSCVRSMATPPTAGTNIASSSSSSPPSSVTPRGSAAAQMMTELEKKYPHTRPAPRISPVVPPGAMPIPGNGPWSAVQTGAQGRVRPEDASLPEGKPGVLGEGIFYGTEFDVWKWEVTHSGAYVVFSIIMFGTLAFGFYIMATQHGSLWGPPPKPAGDYSLEEDKVRDAAFRRRTAEIAAREKAAQLKNQVASEAASLSDRLDSAKDEIAGKVEQAAGKIANNASAQLQYIGERYQELKPKA